MANSQTLVIVAAVLFIGVFAVPERRTSTEKTEEYDEDSDKQFPGKIQIMPIVQRDTKNRTRVTQTVEEIIKELPTDDDDSLDRIGKMLNNSYEKMKSDAAEGETAIRQKISKPQTSTVMKTSLSCLTSSILTILIVVFLR